MTLQQVYCLKLIRTKRETAAPLNNSVFIFLVFPFHVHSTLCIYISFYIIIQIIRHVNIFLSFSVLHKQKPSIFMFITNYHQFITFFSKKHLRYSSAGADRLLLEYCKKETGCDSRTDNSGNIRSHCVHEKEVLRICFLSLHLRYSRCHRYG